jgi:hypothetical protein
VYRGLAVSEGGLALPCVVRNGVARRVVMLMPVELGCGSERGDDGPTTDKQSWLRNDMKSMALRAMGAFGAARFG